MIQLGIILTFFVTVPVLLVAGLMVRARERRCNLENEKLRRGIR